MKCFFVRGLSRSGGTLMATILDAHPEIAMSYETYEHLLKPADGEEADIQAVIEVLKKALNSLFRSQSRSLNKIQDPNLRKFVFRALRAGIDPKTFTDLLTRHAREGLGISDFSGRMRFVERLTMEKAHREGKRYWGAKIVSTYDELAELYPEASFLFMLRDGRDIAASRKRVGDFNQSIDHIARGWSSQVEKFRRFASRPEVRARMVPYERLAGEPEQELRELMEFLGLPWSDRLLSFHNLNLTIHRNPVGHLSGEQVKNPINTASIGRWKEDLTPQEIASFEAAAGEMLARFGYK